MINSQNNFFSALKILIERLKDVDFALIGTFNLSIQGIDMSPNDLDILTEEAGIYKIGEIFDSPIVQANSGPWKEVGFMIGDVEVQATSVADNPLRPMDFKKHIILIEKEGVQIPCMSLESELDFYKKAGREKDKLKVGLIESRLKLQK